VNSTVSPRHLCLCLFLRLCLSSASVPLPLLLWHQSELHPTVQHCSMATLIGLCIRVKLMRCLPPRFKVQQFHQRDTVALVLVRPSLQVYRQRCTKNEGCLLITSPSLSGRSAGLLLQLMPHALASFPSIGRHQAGKWVARFRGQRVRTGVLPCIVTCQSRSMTCLRQPAGVYVDQPAFAPSLLSRWRAPFITALPLAFATQYVSVLAVDKQLNDKERVAAALENPGLSDMVYKCLVGSQL